MVDIETLLPRARTPADYLALVGDPRVDAEALSMLARSPYHFVRTAVARDNRTDAATLMELLDDHDMDRWSRNRLLRLVAQHPNAGRTVLLKAVAAVEAEMSHRPYAAAIALAARPELTADEVRRMADAPGASNRLRRGLRRVS